MEKPRVMRVGRYNKKTLKKLRNAADHIWAAKRNLRYGILQTEFNAQIEQLEAVHEELLKVIRQHGYQPAWW